MSQLTRIDAVHDKGDRGLLGRWQKGVWNWWRSKTAPERRVYEWKDLADIIGSDLMKHPDCLIVNGYLYEKWESNIATPAIEAQGYRILCWWALSADDQRVLIRAVDVEKDGAIYTCVY